MAEFRKDIGDVGFAAGPSGPGVVDTTVAEGLAFLGDTAVKLGEGKALAELEGQEEFATETDIDGDVDISRELDLTKITRARKQGRITGQEALTRAQASVKRAVNSNPIFADAIRKRAQEFFTGGGLGSGNIFKQTPEEQLQAALLKQEAVAQQQEQQEARGAGITVSELRSFKGEVLRNQAKSARLSVQEKEGTVSSQVALDALDGDITTTSLNVMGAVQTAIVSQGGVSPDRKVQIINGIRTQFTLYQNRYKKSLRKAKIPTAEINASLASLKAQRDSLIEQVEDGSLEDLVKSRAGALKATIEEGALVSHLDLAIAKAAGGESASNTYLMSLTNPRLKAVLNKFHPSVAKAGGQSVSNFITPVLKSIYDGSKLSPDLEKLKGVMSSEIAKSSDSSDDDVDVALASLAESAKDSPESIREWQDPTIVAKVKRDPKLQKHVSNVADSIRASLLSSSLSEFGGRFPVDAVSTYGDATKHIPSRVRPRGDILKSLIFTYKGKPVPKYSDKLSDLLNLVKTYPEALLQGVTEEEWMEQIVEQLNPTGEEVDIGAPRTPAKLEKQRPRRKVILDKGKAKLAK